MGSTEYPFPVAVKTGTSQGYRDAWTMAYSREYLVGVWVGRSDAGPMRDVTGAGSAAELARAVMLDLHGDGTGAAALAFPDPPDYRLNAICSESDDAPSEHCSTLPEWTRDQDKHDPEMPANPIQPADDAAAIAIVSPRDDMRVIRNPELPPDLASLPLKATVDPPQSQVTWYVDGKPFLVSAAGEIARWPLQPGRHIFEARIPYRGIASKPVTIDVQ
jgi:penicillin-binding protein 1C